MLFATAGKRFLLDCQARDLALGTQERYKTDLATLGWFLAIRKKINRLGKITPEHLREFVVYLLSRRHRHRKKETLSPFTVDGIYRSCKTFFAFCARERFIRVNPMERVRNIKLPQRLVPRLSDAQVAELIKEIQRTKMSKRNLAMILLLADSGLRRGEMLNLTLDDVHLNEEFVRVVGKGDKQRDVPMGRAALSALRVWIKQRPRSQTRHVFVTALGMPFHKDGVGALFARLRKRLGWKRLYPHLLRHTFATMFLLNSRDAKSLQKILGHSRSSTTLDLYVDYDIHDLRKIHRRASPVDAILKKRRGRCKR